MATAMAQARWRERQRYAKAQLNVTVRHLVHQDLDELARDFELRGKGEGVSFSTFVAKGLQQFAVYDPDARRLLETFREAYDREREHYL